MFHRSLAAVEQKMATIQDTAAKEDRETIQLELVSQESIVFLVLKVTIQVQNIKMNMIMFTSHLVYKILKCKMEEQALFEHHNHSISK